VDLQRNKEGSRILIVLRLRELRSRGEDWITAQDVLGECSTNGPWSEDLQDLVREGFVESEEDPEELGMESLVRLRKNP